MLRFWKKVQKGQGCWIWTAYRDRKGYGQLRVNGICHYAHRFSWELHYGPIPDGLWVLHKCDNPACVNPKHLYLGKSENNIKDMVDRDRTAKGQKHSQAKLTDKQVAEIRRLYGTGKHTQQTLAFRFGVVRQTISKIVRRNNWVHVQG